MFQEKRLVFMYAVSPVHMGSGTSLGVIDNPIQRERHTGHPVFAGSGIKGAAREQAAASGMSKKEINRIFGPDTDASEHAGAVSFSDAQIVAFPVRSLKEGFVYATCPMALARLARIASVAGLKMQNGLTQTPDDEQAIVKDQGLLSNGKLVLESYEFDVIEDENGKLEEIAECLAKHVLSGDTGFKFFKEKLEKHLVVISDSQFGYFVTNATVVEPHVRIDDATGTSDDGGLFFTENVPPESIFVSILMASQERTKKGSSEKGLSAQDIVEKLSEKLNGSLLQVGGDATTGRGQVWISFAGGSTNGQEDNHGNS